MLGSQEWVPWATIQSQAASLDGSLMAHHAAAEEASFPSDLKTPPLGDCLGLPRKKKSPPRAVTSSLFRLWQAGSSEPLQGLQIWTDCSGKVTLDFFPQYITAKRSG